MKRKNDLEFLENIIARLKQASIPCLVFGGWAKELSCVIPPRPHGDVDLLYIANDFEKVDKFLRRESDIAEIATKHFPHKRAFVLEGIMIELLLISRKGNKLLTDFWGEYKLQWPEINPVKIKSASNGQGVEVCPPDVVEYYHRHEKQIAEVRARHLPNH